jgi:zinc protease
VGGLPSKPGAAAQVKDGGIRFPQTSQRDKVELGREPRSNVVVSFFADPSADPVEVENVTAATTVLDIALRDILREDLGQTYTVSVGLAQALPQRGGGHIRVSFGAAPENVAAMTERVFQEVRRLQQEGPSADLTNRARESAKRNYETALQQNGYWLGRLQSVKTFGRDPKEIVTRPARIDAVTPATVQAAFGTYFPMDRNTVVTLVPAATPATAANRP